MHELVEILVGAAPVERRHLQRVDRQVRDCPAFRVTGLAHVVVDRRVVGLVDEALNADPTRRVGWFTYAGPQFGVAMLGASCGSGTLIRAARDWPSVTVESVETVLAALRESSDW